MFKTLRSRFLVRNTAFACSLWLLGCAVGIEPDLDADAPRGSSGKGGGSSGSNSPPIVPANAGNKSTSGGTGAFGGTSTSGGTTSTSGKGGDTSTAGKGGSGSSSGTGGSGGASSAGMGGKGGVAGTSAGGSATTAGSGGKAGGGTGPTSCGDATPWVGADSTLTIAEGETVSWKGKRYVAKTNIAYPNAECAPDAPATWCADWFTADGDC
jgi:hypothetical protein